MCYTKTLRVGARARGTSPPIRAVMEGFHSNFNASSLQRGRLSYDAKEVPICLCSLVTLLLIKSANLLPGQNRLFAPASARLDQIEPQLRKKIYEPGKNPHYGSIREDRQANGLVVVGRRCGSNHHIGNKRAHHMGNTFKGVASWR
jgi:hypothetical protein